MILFNIIILLSIKINDLSLNNCVMKYLKILLSVCCVSSIMFSCNNGGNANKQKSAVSEIDEVSVEQIVEDLTTIPTPTSFELMSSLNNAGIPYVMDITNSLANQENYLSTKQKALNLGVYAADLSYDVTYQKKAETEDYLKCILTMASDLNISVDADKISEKVQNNIDNVEELVSAVKDMIKDSQFILNQTSQTETALLFLIGSWVESAYICVSVNEVSANGESLADVALSHFEYASTIVKYLESKKADADFGVFYEQLVDIQNKTEELKSDKTNVEKREALISAVKSMRNGIV